MSLHEMLRLRAYKSILVIIKQYVSFVITMTNWRLGLALLFVVEVYFFTIGILLHECIHSLSFYILSGRFGGMHFFDAVAYSYSTISVCVPPPGILIQDTFSFELIAYAMTFLATGLFAVLLYKKYYTSEKNKKYHKHIELIS